MRVLLLALVVLACAVPAAARAGTLVTVDATSRKQTTFAGAADTRPCWGRRGIETARTEPFGGVLRVVAFVAYPADGGRAQVVRQIGEDEVITEAVPAPGCARVAELHRGLEKPGAVVVRDRAGKRLLRVAIYRSSAEAEEDEPAAAEVAWSGDGTRLAVRAREEDDELSLRVYALPSGRLLRRFAGGEAIARLGDAPFSPDGRRLAVPDDVNDGEESLRILDVATGRGRTLPSLPESTGGPTAWSPRGGLLPFTQFGYGLSVADARTGRTRALAVGPLKPGGPLAWAQDGRRLAYGFQGVDGDAMGLALIGTRPGDRARALLPRAEDEILPPAWSPDGRRLAVVRD